MVSPVSVSEVTINGCWWKYCSISVSNVPVSAGTTLDMMAPEV